MPTASSAFDKNASDIELYELVSTASTKISSLIDADKSVKKETKDAIKERQRFIKSVMAFLIERAKGRKPDDEPTDEPRPDATFQKFDEKLDAIHKAVLASRSPIISYADATKKSSLKTPASFPALILSSASDEINTGTALRDAFRKSVSFKDANFAPKGVRVISNSKVRVEFETPRQREDAIKLISTSKDIVAEEARRRKPLVILKGISNRVKKEELIQCITNQNPELNLQRLASSGEEPSCIPLRLCYVLSNRNEHLYNAVFEVSGSVRHSMLTKERIAIGQQQVRASDRSPFVQCFKCLGFGHTKAKCTAESDTCSHCAASGHDFRTCPVKDDKSKLKCANCVQASDESNRIASPASKCVHSATSVKDCPCIKAAIKRLQRVTDYSV